MKFLSSLLSFLALTAITAPAQAGLDNEKYQQRHLKVDQVSCVIIIIIIII